MGNTKYTLRDIAKLANVSTTSVHKALHGKGGISEETRRRILKITQQKNYSINISASVLKRGQWTIAVVLPVLPRSIDQFFRKIWEGVEKAEKVMQDYNVTLLRFPCDNTVESQIRIFKDLAERADIHGVITYCWHDTMLNPYFQELKERNIPVVTVDSDASGSCRIACVTASGERTGRLAAELLCKLRPGEGRFLVLGGNQMQSLLRSNSYGFFDYIRQNRPEHGILEINMLGGSSELEEMIVKELEAYEDITGIYCNSASNVLAMCRALKRSGRAGRISAIGSDIFEELIPYLEDGTVDATIWQGPEEQSYRAILLLQEYLTTQQLDREITHVKLGVIMKNNYMDYLP